MLPKINMCMYATCCISFIHKCHDCNLLNVCLGVNCHRCISSTEEQEYERLERRYLTYYSTQPRGICWCSIVTVDSEMESFGKMYPDIHALLFYRQRTLVNEQRAMCGSSGKEDGY